MANLRCPRCSQHIHREVTRWSCISCGWDYYVAEASPREHALQSAIDRDLAPRTLEEPDREPSTINDYMEGMRAIYKILAIAR